MSGRYVDVVFNVPVQGSFTYALGDAAGAGGAESGEGQSGAGGRTADLVGRRVVAHFGRRKLTGFVVGMREEAPAELESIKEITRLVDGAALFDRSYLDLAHWVSRMYFSSLGEALSAMIPGGRKESEAPALGSDDEAFHEEEFALSDEQQDAVRRIVSEPGGRFYLYGITGSGKTEVYLQVAREVLRREQSVIYLVPEISLTHQVVRIIRSRFPGTAAVLHSRLTPSQRLSEWNRIRRGEARLVVGARSAIFAPVDELGMVIVDEEHEGSYKSGSSPRYHARQVAMKRCSDAGARLVLGSATPSVEAWHLMNIGKLKAIRLSRRLAGGSMPHMQLVDLKKEPSPLSDTLIEALKSVHAEGRQSILFLNRRGFGYFFHCRSCGYVMECERCSVTLTYHKQLGSMVCHYCGYRTRPVSMCPECGSVDVGFGGFGTERIEDELRTRLPHMRLERIDTDSVRRKGSLERILHSFQAGELDLLLGTQMVAKGLNFPGVKLVGLIHADTGLLLPDFRAAERTFSLITQVSGRAGRYSPDGTVIIQTLRPDTNAVSMAARGEVERFYDEELSTRDALGFPPFSRLLRLVFRGRDVEQVKRTATEFAEEAERHLSDNAEVMGPAECPLAKIARNHRHQVILRSRAFGETHRALRSLLSSMRSSSGVYWEIDVDPVSLL